MKPQNNPASDRKKSPLALIDLRVFDSGRLGILSLAGNIDAHCINELMERLREAGSRTDRLIINCENAVVTDNRCAHLICSAYRFFAATGKSFLIAGVQKNDFSLKTLACPDCPDANEVICPAEQCLEQ